MTRIMICSMYIPVKYHQMKICFKDFLNEVNHLHSLELENHFIYGFKLGVKILVNVFDTK